MGSEFQTAGADENHEKSVWWILTGSNYETWPHDSLYHT